MLSRKWWLFLGLSLLLLLLSVVGAVEGFFWYKDRQLVRARDTAEQYYTQGNWQAARRNFAFYLHKNPQDVERLLKYADACSKVLEDRPRMLRDVSVAYYQIAVNLPGDAEAVERLTKHCLAIRAWGDLEYYAGRFLVQYPEYTWLRYYRALALEQLDRSQEAVEAYRELVESGTEHIDVYGRLARLWRRLRFESQAVALLNGLIAQRPDDPEAFLQRVTYFLDAGDPKTAQQDLDKAKTLRPDDPQVLLMESRLAAMQRQWREAIAYGEQALPSAPDPVEAYVAVLLACQEQGEIEKAIGLLEDMDPYLRANNPEFFVFHHDLLVLANRLDDAREVLKEYRKLYPKHGMVFEYMEARELLAEGDAPGAVTKLTTVVKNVPAFRQAQYFLALAYLQSYQRERARSTLETLCRNFPDFERARALYQREFGPGETADEALQRAKQLLAEDKVSAETLVSGAEMLLARALQQQSWRDHADIIRKLGEKAIQTDPSYGRSYLLLADLYLRLGELGEVASLLDRAGAAGAETALVRAWLALAQNDVESAVNAFAEERARRDMPVDEILRWANSFAARGKLEGGLAVLGQAVDAMPPEKGEVLRIEEVALCTRFGDLDKALELVAALESQASQYSDLASSVMDQKEQLVHLLLESKTPRYLADAKRLVEELCGANPEEIRYKLLDARVLANQDPPDYEGSRAVLAGLLAENPSNVQVLVAMADLAMRQENLVAALDYARRAAAGALQDVSVQLALAEVQVRSKQYVEAQATLERILTIAPDEPRVLELLLDAYLNTGRVEQARAMLQRLERATPEGGEDSWRLAMLRGKVLVARGEEMGRVEEELRARYVANPDDIDVLRELAIAVQRQGRTAEAEQLLKAFAENHGDREDAWVMLGQYYLSQSGALSEGKASSAFTRALIIRPNYLLALRGLIDLSLRMNNPVQVLLLCDRYLEMQPMSPDILYRKAFLLARDASKLESALAAIQQALALDQKTEYVFFRGTLYLALGRYKEALADLLQVNRTRDVNSAELDMALAEAYLGVDDRKSALQYHESAQRKLASGAKGNPDRLKRLTELLQKENGGVGG